MQGREGDTAAGKRRGVSERNDGGGGRMCYVSDRIVIAETVIW